MDEMQMITVPVKAAKEDDPGACKDSCGNWFVPDWSRCYWTAPTLPPFCGCYCPDELIEVAIGFLENLADEGCGRGFQSKAFFREMACGGYVPWMLMAYMADHFGWTEHGTSVNGAWITEKGRQTLAGLKATQEGCDGDQGKAL